MTAAAPRSALTVALARVVGPVDGDAGDLLIGRDLAEQFGQHRGVTHIAAGDLYGANLQCLLVDPEVDLAPGEPCRAIGPSDNGERATMSTIPKRTFIVRQVWTAFGGKTVPRTVF